MTVVFSLHFTRTYNVNTNKHNKTHIHVFLYVCMIVCLHVGMCIIYIYIYIHIHMHALMYVQDLKSKIGALIVRIGFWGRLRYIILVTRNPKNSIGNY